MDATTATPPRKCSRCDEDAQPGTASCIEHAHYYTEYRRGKDADEYRLPPLGPDEAGPVEKALRREVALEVIEELSEALWLACRKRR